MNIEIKREHCYIQSYLVQQMKWSRKSAKTWGIPLNQNMNVYSWTWTSNHETYRMLSWSVNMCHFWKPVIWCSYIFQEFDTVTSNTYLKNFSQFTFYWKAANFQQFAFQFNSLFTEETNFTDQKIMHYDSVTIFNQER